MATEMFPISPNLNQLATTLDTLWTLSEQTFESTFNAVTKLVSDDLIDSRNLIVLISFIYSFFINKQQILLRLAKKLISKYECFVNEYNDDLDIPMRTVLLRQNLIPGVEPQETRKTPTDKLIFSPKNGSIEYIIAHDVVSQLEQLYKKKQLRINTKIGEDPNIFDFAIRCGSIKCFNFLKELSSAKVTASTVACAFLSRNQEILDYCLSKVAPTKQHMFIYAMSHFPGISQVLVEKYRLAPTYQEVAKAHNYPLIFEKLNRVKKVDFIDKEGNTLLACCAAHGLTEMLKYLIQYGANVNFHPPDREPPLSEAVQQNMPKIVQILLNSGADINYVDAYHKSLMHYAAEVENTMILEMLIAAKAPINLKEDKKADTPLHSAIREFSRPKILGMLLDAGAFINDRNNDGQTPLNLATNLKHSEAAKFLLNRGADPNLVNKVLQPPLYGASYNGDIELVRLLIEKGAKLDMADENGVTPILIALQIERKLVSKTLIEAGCKLDFTDKKGTSPLLMALHMGLHELAGLILDKCNQVDFPIEPDLAPLTSAVEVEDNNALLKKMLNKGANVNVYGTLNVPALNKAAMHNNFEAIKLLAEKGVDLNHQDKNGDTAAHVACQYDNVESLKALIDAGAQVALSSKNGDSPLHVCAQFNGWKCAKALLNAGISPEACDKNGSTALLVAALDGKIGVVKTIVRCGGDVNAINNKGMSPFLAAMSKDYTKIACYLLKHGASVDVQIKGRYPAVEYIEKNKNKDIIKCMLTYKDEDMKKLLGSKYESYVRNYEKVKTNADASDDEMGEVQKKPQNFHKLMNEFENNFRANPEAAFGGRDVDPMFMEFLRQAIGTKPRE